MPGRLPFNTLVDMNGRVLSLPLPTSRMIAFRVARIKTEENKGSRETFHFLELMSAGELASYTRGGSAAGGGGFFGRTVVDDF